MKKYRILLLLVIIGAAFAYSSPAIAQFDPTCPQFYSFNLEGGETKTVFASEAAKLNIGQASYGVEYTQASGTFAPLPQWPSAVSLGREVQVVNTTVLTRAVYYCYRPEATATPTATATRTPIATRTPTTAPSKEPAGATNTPTATPVPNSGPCYSGTSQLLTDQYGNDWKAVFPVPPFTHLGGQYYQPPGGNWFGWRIRFRELNGTTSTAVVRISDGVPGLEEIEKNNTFYSLTSGTTPVILYTVEPGASWGFQWDLCDPTFFAPTATPTNTATAAPTQPAPPTTTRTPTATPYPTPAAGCTLQLLGIEGSSSTYSSTDEVTNYIYVQNGIALVEHGGRTDTIDENGITTVGPITISVAQIFTGAALRVVICFVTVLPTATVTPTATIGSLGCAGSTYTIPVAPDRAEIPLTNGGQFIVADATVYVNLPNYAQPLEPGTQTWTGASGMYVVYTVTTSARIVVCVTAPPTLAPTWAPTWTPGPAPSVCVAPATPVPAQTGQLPDLALDIPTLAPLPSMTPPAATVITATIIISPAHTAVALFVYPVQTAAAWCAATFGANGYARAQVDAAPVVSGVATAFGWLAVLDAIGPLAWLLPPLLITVLIRVGRPILSAVKYVKQILPFQ